VLRLQWVGRADRAIRTPPTDAAMVAAIEAFAGQANPKPRSDFLTVDGQPIFRTIYPSFGKEQSCIDCHNKLQPIQHWRLGDLMGAFSIDVPAAPFLTGLTRQCALIGFGLFVAMGCIGLLVSILHYRQITEREAAQRRIEESEMRFRDFAEAASDWFWEQDEQLRICFVSENELSRRVGSTAANQIGKSRWEVVTLGVTDEQKREHQECLEEHRPFQRFRFQRIDLAGELRHIELNGKPIFDRDDNFKGYRGTARDVTAEIANELELARRVEERTAELRSVQGELLRKERLSTLGQFTATVAHELRNPLSAIRNTAFMIGEMAAAGGVRLDRPLARLARSIGRCDGLIGDLLEYARIRELKRMRLGLDDWLGEVLDEQKLPGGTRLRRDFGMPGVQLDIDPDRLRRVVINLVDNAAQAMTEMPADTIRDRVLTVSTRQVGEVAHICFVDTGPGIAPDVLPKVFEPLFSTRGFGTGLGLPTVRQIVEQHSGTVDIASEPGVGTQVLITLSVAPAGAMAA
jgi:PAS domain S-box-containing protein